MQPRDRTYSLFEVITVPDVTGTFQVEIEVDDPGPCGSGVSVWVREAPAPSIDSRLCCDLRVDYDRREGKRTTNWSFYWVLNGISPGAQLTLALDLMNPASRYVEQLAADEREAA